VLLLAQAARKEHYNFIVSRPTEGRRAMPFRIRTTIERFGPADPNDRFFVKLADRTLLVCTASNLTLKNWSAVLDADSWSRSLVIKANKMVKAAQSRGRLPVHAKGRDSVIVEVQSLPGVGDPRVKLHLRIDGVHGWQEMTLTGPVVKLDNVDPCGECGGILRAAGTFLVCTECGWVIEP